MIQEYSRGTPNLVWRSWGNSLQEEIPELSIAGLNSERRKRIGKEVKENDTFWALATFRKATI